MSEEDYLYYSSSIQYLGTPGITQPCMLAMASILTSAFRPEKIIAVIGGWKEPGDTGSSERVLFVVWHWFYPNLTIIPDGFGTHSGEGGTGLSAVLGLIQLYNIPMLQTWIDDHRAFRELAEGQLSKATFEALHRAQTYNWRFHPVSTVRKVKRGKHKVVTVYRDNGHLHFEIQLL